MERLVVMGHGRHGKDTVCELLRDRYGFKFVSSSEFVAEEAVFPVLRERYGYATLEECYADRHNHRSEWYDLISEYNEFDAARLGRKLFEQYDIYCGIRNRRELNAIKREKLCDCVIWVDASRRLPVEDPTSISVGPDQSEYILDNNGTLEDLEVEVDALVRWLSATYS